MRVKFIREESNASTRARNACLNLKEEGCCYTVLQYHQNELPKDCILFCIRLSGGQELVAQGARDRFTYTYFNGYLCKCLSEECSILLLYCVKGSKL